MRAVYDCHQFASDFVPQFNKSYSEGIFPLNKSLFSFEVLFVSELRWITDELHKVTYYDSSLLIAVVAVSMFKFSRQIKW